MLTFVKFFFVGSKIGSKADNADDTDAISNNQNISDKLHKYEI